MRGSIKLGTNQKSELEMRLRKSTILTITQLWDDTSNGSGDIFHFLFGIASELRDDDHYFDFEALDDELEFLLNILNCRNL